ncbi:MAG: hypothetical protein VX899_19770 [Myxococcota bacterium]|nr:hypothetical protein [Myxococcota bacterium]
MTLMLLAALACKKDEDPGVDDSNVVVDDTSSDDTGQEVCEAKPAEVVPEDEADEVYHRDLVEIAFTQSVSGASFTLGTVDGLHSTEFREDWNDAGDRVTLVPGRPLEPDQYYLLEMDVCGTTYQSTFTTSDLGLGLVVGPEDLLERTYLISLDQVEFTKPENVAALVKTFLDMPLLVNIHEVDEGELFLVGAEGWIDGQGDVRQRKRRNEQDVPTWDFEGVDFTQAPYFSADSAGIVIVYDGVDIPISDFHLEGTLTSDGSAFGGGRLWGLADTRNTAPLLGESDPGHVCGLIEGFGAECEACPDGELYCLYIEGHEIYAEQVEVANEFERIEAAPE